MFGVGGEYWTAMRHPWSCLLFVLPLLIIYELALRNLGADPAETWRNGADVWLRSGLASMGIPPAFGLPLALLLILLAWTVLYREARPADPLGVLIGMSVECVIFAGVLYGMSQMIWPFLHSFGGMLEGQAARLPPLGAFANDTPAGAVAEPALINLVRYLGAGIYEEALFRLLFFSGLLTAFNLAELPRRWGIGLAALASALLFAGAAQFGRRGRGVSELPFLFSYLSWRLFRVGLLRARLRHRRGSPCRL